MTGFSLQVVGGLSLPSRFSAKPNVWLTGETMPVIPALRAATK